MKDKEFEMGTVSQSIQKVSISDFGAVIQRGKNGENGSNRDQPPKPVKAILKVEKNRDRKTGKTNLYFDYPRSSILPNWVEHDFISNAFERKNRSLPEGV